MMERNGDVLRSVAWAELFPWLNIYKTFRLAIGFRALVMSALAVLLTATGWWMFGHIFSPKDADAPSGCMQSYAECPWKELTGIVPDRPEISGGPRVDERRGRLVARRPEDMKTFCRREWRRQSPTLSVPGRSSAGRCGKVSDCT